VYLERQDGIDHGKAASPVSMRRQHQFSSH
jgi:hypothetical protein